MSDALSADEAVPVAEFRAALRGFLRTSERNARAAGLTPQRYLLLLMIKGAPDRSEQSTVTDLAERLQLAQSTVTELVSRAEEIGLVQRERSSDDGRIANLSLTEEGERRLAESFTSNERERQALREAFANLQSIGRRRRIRACASMIRTTAPPEAATTRGPRVSRPSSAPKASTPGDPRREGAVRRDRGRARGPLEAEAGRFPEPGEVRAALRQRRRAGTSRARPCSPWRE